MTSSIIQVFWAPDHCILAKTKTRQGASQARYLPISGFVLSDHTKLLF
jgi:hypothetical protein